MALQPRSTTWTLLPVIPRAASLLAMYFRGDVDAARCHRAAVPRLARFPSSYITLGTRSFLRGGVNMVRICSQKERKSRRQEPPSCLNTLMGSMPPKGPEMPTESAGTPGCVLLSFY